MSYAAYVIDPYRTLFDGTPSRQSASAPYKPDEYPNLIQPLLEGLDLSH